MIKAILTDIEGTTTSISFVHDTLFPFSKEHLSRFVEEHAEDATVKEILQQVRDRAGLCDDTLGGVLLTLQNWIKEDRKETSLKALQGLIWEEGYNSGELKGHLYEEVPDYFRDWSESGTKLYVYSSGSIKAQKLLFGNTEYGDMMKYFSGYFDTTTGPKKESASYEQISKEIGFNSEEILFLSDVTAELDAAHAAGMKTILLVRDSAQTENTTYPIARDFSEVNSILSKLSLEDVA